MPKNINTMILDILLIILCISVAEDARSDLVIDECIGDGAIGH